jgi:hypothetical protein
MTFCQGERSASDTNTIVAHNIRRSSELPLISLLTCTSYPPGLFFFQHPRDRLHHPPASRRVLVLHQDISGFLL